MKSKYKNKPIDNIENLYNIKDIYKNHYINNENNAVVIYEITPIVITDNINETQDKIYEFYLEFLKTIDFDFKIYIENDYYEVKNQNITTNEYKESLREEYFNNLKELVNKNQVFIKTFYLIVTVKNINELKELDRHINILKNIGLEIKLLDSKQKIEYVLYKSINRR